MARRRATEIWNVLGDAVREVAVPDHCAYRQCDSSPVNGLLSWWERLMRLGRGC